MTTTAHWIVFSDLDGTLLDHHSYDFSAAKPALDRLRQHHYPLILNSSKTAAEMLSLRRQLDNHHPFIVENGSALYVPRAYFPDETTDATNGDKFSIITFGADYALIVDVLSTLRRDQRYQFTGFNDFSVEQLAESTGLSLEQATLAKQRAASEPLVWRDSEERLTTFTEDLAQLGLSTLKGGRFLHVLGHTDKARPIRYLMARYRENWPEKNWRAIALGDSNNDAAMLAAVDCPVIVKNPQAQPLTIELPALYRTEQIGPAGWNEAINFLLSAQAQQQQ